MKLTAIACAALALSAGAASAEDLPGDDAAATRADVKCVLAMSAMLRDPQYKDGATAGLFYYLGRLDGRHPSFELGPALKRAAGDMQLSEYASQGRRCGAEVRARNEALKQAGEAIRPRGVGR